MKVAGGRVLCVLGLLAACLLGSTRAQGQAGAANQAGDKPLLAEQAFKNVQVLRGIPAKEFMETMGFFAASLSLNCSDCHGASSGSDWASYAVDPPLKQTARRMVLMVNQLNSANFGGMRSVTCYTCHRGSRRPQVIPSLQVQYAEPPDVDPDLVEPVPGAPVTVKPEEILDRYIQAVGGAAAAAKLTSFTGKGTYNGFDSEFADVPLDMYAKSPNMRSMVVHMRGGSGDSTTTYDGQKGWASGPISLVPIPVVELAGDGLLGARFDAQVAFPAQIKQLLTDWRAGFPNITIDDKPVDVIDGKMPGGVRVKLFFDKETGLLVRQARFTETKVGTIATHIAYSDYRPVAGVKIPFGYEMTWVDGQATVKLDSVQANAAIDASKFAKPSPPTSR